MSNLPPNTSGSEFTSNGEFAVPNPMVVAPFGANEPEQKHDHGLSNEILKSRIVVIDDEPAVTQIIRKEMISLGFDNVMTFNRPKLALEEIKNNGVDVVLLDVRIPEIDGISILRFFRAQEATQFVPVIVLTSVMDEATRIKALAAGANDYLTKPVNGAELIQRVKNALCFKQYTDRIEQQVETVKKELQTDALTGLNNRRSFDEYYPKQFEQAEFRKVSLILFDIDKFKFTNDSYGHHAGDLVLQRVSKITRSLCGPEDFAARIGGDEFAIVSVHDDPEWPETLAEQIRGKVCDGKTDIEGEGIKTTVSVGIATANDVLNEKGSLFKSADAALYQSKRQGRNAINVYSDAGAISIGHNHLTKIPTFEETMSLSDPKRGRILIVDDEPTVTKMLELQLQKSGYASVSIENDATNAITRIQEMSPDLVILDIRMPGINGLEILRQMRDMDESKSTPVLIMTSTYDERVRMAALKLQANDFLVKPTKTAELDARVCNSLMIKHQHDRLRGCSERLRHEIEVRTSELFATRRETILCLARAAETRDTETGNHVIRVGHYAAIIARQMKMDDDYIGWIELAAQLHDVGKLSIPDSILNKPGALTQEERKVMETHCEQADRIFFGRSSKVEKAVITSPLLKMASRIASTHHERWDGSGYPNGISGEDIPVEGRITAVADVFDALSTKRHYKEAFATEKCFDMIMDGCGTHFDPTVVDAFFEAKGAIVKAMEQWQDRCNPDSLGALMNDNN